MAARLSPLYQLTPPPTGGGGGGFTPSSITGLIAWFAADGSVYNIGTTQATDGQTVTTWVAGSPLTNNATATGTSKPIFKTGIINGKPVIRFDGSDDFFTISSALSGSAMTVIAVVTNSASNAMLCGDPISGHNFQWRLTYGGANTVSMYGGSSEFQSSTLGVALTSFSVLTFSFGATGQIWQNGLSYGSGPVGGTSWFESIGKSGVGVNLSGDLAEIVVYNSQLGATDRQSVENYLKAKYAL